MTGSIVPRTVSRSENGKDREHAYKCHERCSMCPAAFVVGGPCCCLDGKDVRSCVFPAVRLRGSALAFS